MGDKKGVYGTGGDTQFRRTWDKAEYLEKARLREEEAKKGKKRLRDDKELPTDAELALLKHRDAPINFTKNLNKVQVVQTGAPGSAPQAGFPCEVCGIVCKDNITYLDHINSRQHLRNIGMSMKVEKVTADQVKQKLESLKKKTDTDPAEDLKKKIKEELEKEEEEKRLRKEEKKNRKKRKKEEKEKDSTDFTDDSIAAIMGFGKFA